MNRPYAFALSTLTLAAASCVLAPTAAPAQTAKNDKLPEVFTMSPTGVNLQTGKFNPSFTDLSIGPLTLVRDGPQPSFGGFGFAHNFGAGLYTAQPSGSSPIMTIIVEGKTIKWASTSGGVWIPWNEEAQGTDLTLVGGKWRLVGRGGQVYQFMPHAALTSSFPNGTQVLERVDYADGSRLDYSYNSSAQLRTVTSNRGYAIVFDYDGNGLIGAACGYNTTIDPVDAGSSCAAATLKASYAYSPVGTGLYLTSVTDAGGGVTGLQYNSGGHLSCVTIPNTQTCRITNYYGPQPGDASPFFATSRQVRKQVTATGETWWFEYDKDYDNEVPPQPGQPVYSWSHMVDPEGNRTSIRYDRGLADQLFEPGGALTQYQFNGSVPMKFTLPEGNIVELARDIRQNLVTTRLKAKPSSGLADIVSSADYPATRYDPPNEFSRPVGCQAASQKLCDKPNYTIDAKGNRTDFTYDPAHGGVLTETGPAVNGIRPQTRYEYQQRTAWVKNGSGGWSPAAAPVWLLVKKSSCKTSGATGNPASPCATPGDEVVTTFDYGPDSGPNNLELRGTVIDAGGLNLRSCQSFDARGNKISETGPGANLAACN